MGPLFEQFIAKWAHPSYPLTKVQISALVEVEKKLGPLPQVYKDAVSTYGLPYTPNLLDTIVERDLDLSDISGFLTPDEIVSATEGWRPLGLPTTLVAFADDCAGNLFCFRPEDQPSSDAVWFFDHDLIETYEAAPSFAEWMRRYCDL